GGVQRTLKFVKYLPQCGWLPVVHTVSNPYWPLQDASLLSEVPRAVTVHRTRTFEFEALARSTDTLLSSGTREPSRPRGGSGERRSGNLVRRILSAIANSVFRHVLLPDPQIAWVPLALVKSLYLVRTERVSAIYTTSPPNSGQVLGLLLKRVVGLPWIADFRDEWTEGIRRKLAYQKSPLRG